MRKDKKEIRNLLRGKAVADGKGRLVTPEAGTFRSEASPISGPSLFTKGSLTT